MPKHIRQWLHDSHLSMDELVDRTNLERRLIEAIVAGQYTPSPAQRQKIAAAFGASLDDITWDHAIQVDHMYGHGPQFGRSP